MMKVMPEGNSRSPDLKVLDQLDGIAREFELSHALQLLEQAGDHLSARVEMGGYFLVRSLENTGAQYFGGIAEIVHQTFIKLTKSHHF